MNEHLYPKDSDEETLDVQPARKKWFHVDFNMPGRTVVVAKDWDTWRDHREMAGPDDLPDVGEVVMLYSMDDLEPFAFEAKVYEVDERDTCWIVHSREHGPAWHWRAPMTMVTPEDF